MDLSEIYFKIYIKFMNINLCLIEHPIIKLEKYKVIFTFYCSIKRNFM
jgi:hypothetical protein